MSSLFKRHNYSRIYRKGGLDARMRASKIRKWKERKIDLFDDLLEPSWRWTLLTIQGRNIARARIEMSSNILCEKTPTNR